MTSAPDETSLTALDDATARLLDTVRTTDLMAPSLLPRWTRAHVVAHLALNAEGLAQAVRTAGSADALPMYDSDDARDGDIDELARADPDALLDRLSRGCAAYVEAVRGPADWAAGFERTPGGAVVPMAAVVPMRRREVEIHHADLGAGYGYTDWPDDFTIALLDSVTVDQSDSGPFTVRADDLDRSWPVGSPTATDPTVSEAGSAIAWWLTGRGGSGLAGELPGLDAWRSSRRR